jgi:hypothetical protein
MPVQPLPYRREGGCFQIEMHLGQLRQLFNTLDPSPFHERDLDRDAEHYLISAAEELPGRAVFKIRLYLPAEVLDTAAAARAPDAIRHYFVWQASEAQRRLRAHLREARTALSLGGLFLALCLAFSTLVGSRLEGLGADFLREGALILGWVALWRPLDMFLYAWRPLHREVRNLHRIATAAVELRPAAAGASGAPLTGPGG